MVSPDDILNSMAEAVFLLDRDLRIVYANRAAEEELPVVGRALRDGDLLEALPWLVPLREAILAAVSAGRTSYFRSIATPMGSTWARLTPYVHNGADEGVVLTIGPLPLSPDERDLVAFESMDGIVAQIAHEINNPLGGIRGAAQLMTEQTPAPMAEGLKVIIREVDRLASIVGDLKGFASVSGVALEKLNIHEVLDHALSVIAPEREGVTVRRFYDPSLPEVCGNSGRLLQVFLNLFKNAAEALSGTPGQRLLTIRTRPSELYAHRNGRTLRWAEVGVADNGPGISPHEIERVFLPFHTTKTGGTGLGLAISKKILMTHGGFLRVENAKGGGALFKAFIPFASSAEGCSDDGESETVGRPLDQTGNRTTR